MNAWQIRMMCSSALMVFVSSTTGAASIVTYTGTCEPSGAVAMPEGSFGDMFVVADDENNTLRAYRFQEGGAPVVEFDLDTVLKPTPEREADFEAATWLDGRAYLIGSHSRNKDGKLREDRWQFFSVTMNATAGTVEMELTPPASLHSLLATIGSLDPGLKDAIRLHQRQIESLAPDNGGFNIEGMTVAKDGTGILIGLRSPQLPHTPDPANPEAVERDAVVIPFTNPAEAVGGGVPELAPPILVDLGGHGIRSMEYSSSLDTYLLIAGPVGEDEPFALYRWSGEPAEDPILLEAATATIAALESFTPEAMIIAPDGDQVLLLSDDGDICTSPPSFRGTVVEIQ